MTPEEVEEEVEYQRYVDRVQVRISPIFFLFLMSAFFLACSLGWDAVACLIAVASIPGSVAGTFLLFVKDRASWKEARRRSRL